MSKSLARKTIDEGAISVKFATFAQQLCDWVDTTNMVIIGGRGVAKSTVIIARRLYRCVHLMPGAPLAIVANTYANLIDNIMPAVQNGWKLQGWIEGVHYIKGRRPPESWRRRCSVIVDDYRHVYSFYNGAVLFLGSLDNPSLLAGKSVAHLVFDEAKFASDQRAARVMPILRGDAITYGHCYLYGGVTITTDMPDVADGEFDWFFRYAAQMDPERIVRIIQAADQRNKQLLKLHQANQAATPDEGKIDRIEQRITYYDIGLNKARRGATFFVNISSLANIDILTLDYAKRMYEGALELHEFLKSVLGMRPGLKRGERFYALFTDDHKYTDGTHSGEEAFNWRELVWLQPDAPIDGGMDFGNMNSLVIGQIDALDYRVLKNFYVLSPDSLRELADRFLEFFAGYPTKTLRLYYDRAGNSNQAKGEDAAGKIKECIEYDAQGRRTGWTVELMSRKQSNIGQDQEYYFMQDIMRGNNKRLPRLLVDAVNCAELVSSIEGARVKIRYRGQLKIIGKDKRGEKLPLQKLPRHSTNLSDAFKYLLMRRDWLKAASATVSTGGAGGASVEDWFNKRK